MNRSSLNHKIRYARTGDSAELARLRWELTANENTVEHKDEFIGVCKNWVSAALESDRWFVAVASAQDSTLIGCMYLQLVDAVPSPDDNSQGWGYVTNSYVSSSHRNIGIGSELIQLLLKTARERRLELLIVWPSEDSVSFYKRAGFRPTNEIHAEEGDHPPLEIQI